MATNLVYRNTDAKNRVEDLGETLAPGVAVLTAAIKPAVTVTGSADYTTSETFPGVGTLSGIPAGGVGLKDQEVTLAEDGTWEFDEDSIAGTTAATATQGLAIYADETVAGAVTLTTTATDNTPFGTVDFPPDYDKTRGMVPVKIGA